MAERRTRGLVLGKILGAPVIVQPSTILMLVLLAYVFASSGGAATRRTFAIGVILAFALVCSVLLHEVAHAIAARAFGRRVSEIVLTLWGGHTSFDSANLTPAVSGVTAAAGPAMNLLIAGAARGGLAVAGDEGLMGLVLAYLAWANVALAVFNILPGIPMDGGRVLEAFVWRATGSQFVGTRVAAWGGRVVALALVGYVLGWPYLHGDTPRLFDVMAGGLVFSILWPSASAALRYSSAMMKRDSVTVASVMRAAVAVPYTATVAEAQQTAEGAAEVVVIGADGAPAGRFEVASIGEVPEELRASTSLQAVTLPLPRGAHIDASGDAEEMVARLREWWGRTDALVALDGDQIVGTVRLVDVTAALT